MDINSIGMSQEVQKLMTSVVKQNSDKDFKDILSQAIDAKDDKKLRESCEEVESYMIYQMFKQMKNSTTWGESLIPKGDYEKMFEDFLTQKQSDAMTKAGGIGIADMMYKQLLRK